MKTREELIDMAQRAITEAKKYRDIMNAQDELISLREDDIRFLIDIIKEQDELIMKLKNGKVIPDGLASMIDSMMEKSGPQAENRKKALLKRQEEAEKNYKKFVKIIEREGIDIANLKKAALETTFHQHGLKLSESTIYTYQQRYKKLFS